MKTPRVPAATRGKAVISPIRALLATQRPAFMQAARLSLVIAVLSLIPSWYMLEVYGRVLSSRNHETLAWLVFIALGLYAILELLEVARSRVLLKAASAINEQLTPRVFDTCFVAKLRKVPGGNTQALADVRTVVDFLPSGAVTAVMDLPTAVLCLVLLHAMNPWLGLAATIGALMQAGIGWYQHRRTAEPLAEASQASLAAQIRASGTLGNAKVVESMGMEGVMYQRWMQSQQRYLVHQSFASDHAGTAAAGTRMIQTMQGSMLLGLACWAALENSLAGGMNMVIVASILGSRALAPTAQLVGQWRQIGNARSAYARLTELLTTVEVPEPGMALPAPAGMLTVEGLLVGAPGGKAPILKNVSFGARPGELLVILGPSAAGKSTLARALVGVWPSQAGNVRLDGADVFTWHKSQLGPHVGYMPQGVELFDGTIAENIARFGPLDDEAIRMAAADVGITGFIESLPDGFDTAIGEDGAMLSGGQRQRIALARAVYGRPRLVVLDEPNAHLDEAGEQDLLTLMNTLKSRGTTVIAITHRGNLIGAADKLVLLVDGAVAMFGPRADVLAALQKANEQARAKAKASVPASPPGLPLSLGRPALAKGSAA
jgi:ATP-binding cassette subfamily C exporter for protease/lipase